MKETRSCGCGHETDVSSSRARTLSPEANIATESDVLEVSSDIVIEDGCYMQSLQDSNLSTCEVCVRNEAVVSEKVLNIPEAPPVEESAVTDARIDVGLVVETISVLIDESVALALESGSSSVERLLMLREGIIDLLVCLSTEEVQDVLGSLTLLRTILGNAKELPDEKYRSLKTTSDKFIRLIYACS